MNITIGSDLSHKIHQEFRNESDRGCAILTVCLLEESLLNLFIKVLPSGEEGSRQLMPRGRLNQGVKYANALGLITDPLTANLHKILKIRNIFAHKLLENLSFENQEIRNLVMNLSLPNLEGVSPSTRNLIENSSRARYMEVFCFAIAALEHVCSVAQKYPLYNHLPQYSIEV